MLSGYRGRFAPSPTGLLHIGSAATAVICGAVARASQGVLVLRIEDIDTPRVVAGATEAILDDLRWLGVEWEEGPDRGGPFAPYEQSRRNPLYEAAIDRLARDGLTYYCDCSRAEIARVASAPHAGDEGPRYPGTCRANGMRAREFRRSPALRLAVPEGSASEVTLHDAVLGRIETHVGVETGDFVLRRGDGVFAYQLAVVVDDLAMQITDIVRGADLASSAPRQALLAKLLGGIPPRFAHLPIVTGSGGERLAKRAPGLTIREQREAGRDPHELVRAIARAYGVTIDTEKDPISALGKALDLSKLGAISIEARPIVGE